MRSLRRFGIFFIASALFGCHSVPPPPSEDPEEGGKLTPVSKATLDLDLAEATFRYQFNHNASGQRTGANVYCLSIGPRTGASSAGEADPSPAFIARFADVSPPVKPISACGFGEGHMVIDKATKQTGLIFVIEAISCANATTCTVGGGYYEANESSSGDDYNLVRVNGRWTVVGDHERWIS